MPYRRGRRGLLFFFLVGRFQIEMRVIARGPAARQQKHDNANPPQRASVPGILRSHRSRRGSYGSESNADSKRKFYVPGDQIQVPLSRHLRPDGKERHQRDQKFRYVR